jgi:molybdopterin synthase catalytic subunit
VNAVGTQLVGVSTEPLDVAAHEAAAGHRGAGAVVSFRGAVRERDHDRAVVQLEYQAHPSAQSELERIAAEVCSDPNVLGLAVSHRVGTLRVGDVALAAAVACEHRSEAFALCARLVEQVKHRLPVWKRQVFADGTDEWVNCP